MFKSNKRSEDPYIGLVDFLFNLFRKKSLSFDAIRCKALFEFN